MQQQQKIVYNYLKVKQNYSQIIRKKLFVPCSGEDQLNFNLSIIKTKTFYYYSNSNNYFVARERAAFFDLNLILTKTLMQF